MNEKNVVVYCHTKELRRKLDNRSFSDVYWAENCYVRISDKVWFPKEKVEELGYTIISAEDYLEEKVVSEFKVGDRVECVRHISIKVGEKGRIVITSEKIDANFVSVEWDNLQPHGHDCEGASKDGHGYNIDKEFLKLTTNNQTIKQEETMSISINETIAKVFPKSIEDAKLVTKHFNSEYTEGSFKDFISLRDNADEVLKEANDRQKAEDAKK